MKKLYLFIPLALVFIFLSCNNDDIDNSAIQASVDVYVAGQKDNNACYWKNNTLIMLDDSGYSNTSAQKIIVQNNNVYVWGAGLSNLTSSINYLYWENGVLTNLSNTFEETDYSLDMITDMDVVGNDVYLMGYLKNTTTPTVYDLVYWKNGIKTVILQNCVYRNRYSYINVVNNIVYVLSKNETNQTGVFIDNSFNSINNYIKYNMAINGNDVYIHGSITGTSGFYTNVNTTDEILVPYGINDIVFDGSDIYTVVNYNNQSFRRMIQKNDIPYYISPEGFETHIIDLDVREGNVYTIVRELTSFDFGPNKLLINNVPELVLDYTAGLDNYMNSLYVVQN